MGSMLAIFCDGCDLDEVHSVGVGMMGTEYGVYTCTSCRALVTLEWSVRDGESEPAPLCPQCSGPVSRVREGPEPETPCPVCAGTLSLAVVGLWD